MTCSRSQPLHVPVLSYVAEVPRYVQRSGIWITTCRRPKKQSERVCIQKIQRSNSHGICRALGYGERHGAGLFRGLNYPASRIWKSSQGL